MKKVAWGLGAVGVYVVVAVFVAASPVGITLLFDGFGPPVPYRYVDPPPDLAEDNLRPLEGDGGVALSEEGSLPTAVATGDGQMQVVVPGDVFAARANQELVEIRIVPRVPPSTPLPPSDLEIDGNAYEVTASYSSSGEKAALEREVTVVMRYPAHAEEILRLDGARWESLETQRSEPSLQAFADTGELGTFVTAGAPVGGRSWLPYVVAGLGVLAGVAGYLWGRRGPRRADEESR